MSIRTIRTCNHCGAETVEGKHDNPMILDVKRPWMTLTIPQHFGYGIGADLCSSACLLAVAEELVAIDKPHLPEKGTTSS